ncbi:MAG: T9SS type A sorting domain-containing protein [Ignavibacteriaceae bacterium]|nr:T9SS type A sorting domain-containing protein [Ignavibacteriaceae bacterium]
MLKKIPFIAFLLVLLAIPAKEAEAQQLLDSADVLYFDNTSDNNVGTTGTLMNDPTYREFPPTVPITPGANDGFYSNNSSIYLGGNHRRASRFGSGNNTGARAQYYASLQTSDHYLIYHHMNSGNATKNAYVTFQRFGEGTIADSFRYDMSLNNTPDGWGSWVPLGIIEAFAADSSITVEIGLDSLGSNTLRVDGLAFVRSRKAGPDIEFGARRFSRVFTNPAQETTLVHNFYSDRSLLGFPETTFKYGFYSEKVVPIYNLGSQTLTVTGYVAQTTRYSVTTAFPINIPPGGKANITVRFSPLGEETTYDTLKILSNDAEEPEALLPCIGTGINYNFILNASTTGGEPHWNVPNNSGTSSTLGTFLNSTPSPYPYPIPGGNIGSIVNTGSDPNIAVYYGFQVPDTLSGKYFLEYSGPLGSSNAAQQVTADIVTPFYLNPDPALGDTQRVVFNSRISGVFWGRLGGNTVFELNGGGPTAVRFTNPLQGGTELLRADLLRIRLVPIAPTVSTSLDPTRLLNFGSVSIYDSIRLQQFNFQRNFIIGSNGETPLRVDTIYMKNGTHYSIANLPTFPITLPAIDGEYNLLINFLPDEIISYSDTIFIKTNDPVDTLVAVRLAGQGVGTGILVDDTDPTTYIFPTEVQEWTGAPDPLNMDKWYRITGSGGANQNRLIKYIYFNPINGTETVEWFPYIPFKPGSTTNEIDSFDVFVQLPTSSSISSPMAKYLVHHLGFNSPDTIYVNQNGTANGGQVGASGRVLLGRFQFLRGGQDYHNSGTVFGYVQLLNDTAAVSWYYRDSVENVAKRDSFVLRADAIILEQAGNPLVITDPSLIPDEFALSQNFPNPFNPTTQIRFSLPMDSDVSLKIYDMLGREVATLVRGDHKAGYYTVEWNGRNDYGVPVSSGMYIYRIKAGNFVQTKKMMMMK